MRLRLVKEPFDDPDYIFELKHDGFRAVAYIDSGDCRFVSRNLKALPFKSLRASLATISGPQNAILDGEIVVLDHRGVSRFNSLLSRKGQEAALFYAFDLIWVNGWDLRQTPLTERKARLRALVSRSKCQRLLYAQHVEVTGKKFFEEICARDLEGIVAKKKMGLYREDRPDWLKIKNHSYSQAEGRHEMLQPKRRKA